MNFFDSIIAYALSIKGEQEEALTAEMIKNFILSHTQYVDATLATNLSRVKGKLVKDEYFDDVTVASIIGDTKLYEKVAINAKEKRKDIEVETYSKNVIDKIVNLKYAKDIRYKRPDIYSIYLYLLFVSGLRTNELWQNEISVIDKHTISVKHISKRKFDTKDSYEVKLTIPSDEFLNLYNFMSKTLIERNIKYSTIGSNIDAKIKIIDPKLHAHSLRSMYLYYITKVQKALDKQLPSVQTKELLNHTNESTSIFYNGKVILDVSTDIFKEQYDKMTVKQIKELLDQRSIKYTTKMLKPKLIELLV
jgi:integrase